MVDDLSQLWSELTDWLYKPFTQQLDPINWLLLILIAAVIAVGWKMILDNVLEQ